MLNIFWTDLLATLPDTRFVRNRRRGCTRIKYTFKKQLVLATTLSSEDVAGLEAVYCIKFVRYYNGIRRLGEGGS